MGKLLSFGNNIDFEKLEKAIKERDRFLERNPHMKRYQREIDHRMKGAGSFENRMAILSMMMNAKLMELHEQCKALVVHVHRLEKALEGPAEKKVGIIKKR